jgi:RNase H-fold protein (predicted Holliday junction resolvase)
MRQQGLDHEEIRKLVDSESAAIILRDFIDQNGLNSVIDAN